MPLDTVLVVGASLAGLNAAEALRREGYDGRLVIVGDEPERPYDRPPLSKEVLRGEWEPERTALRKDDALGGLEAEWLLGRRAVSLDVAGRNVVLDDGEPLAYDGLVVATGAWPRTLPGTPEMDGVFTLRTLGDAVSLHAAISAAERVTVVGAGFIGLEVAASARMVGKDVTVLEVAPVPLAHAIGPEVGGALAEVHRQQGVDLRCGVGVDAIEGGDRVERVRLTDGSVVEADVVVVGIGVAPATGWLEGSGLTIDNGVVCDETCLAAPGVVAAGDVCRWPNPLFGETMRVEHWDNAVQQGMAAGKRLLAGDGPGEAFAPVPYFWSDQYDLKVQFVGRGGERVDVVEGEVGSERYAVSYSRDGVLVGALAVKTPRTLMKLRMAIADRTPVDDALAALAS